MLKELLKFVFKIQLPKPVNVLNLRHKRTILFSILILFFFNVPITYISSIIASLSEVIIKNGLNLNNPEVLIKNLENLYNSQTKLINNKNFIELLSLFIQYNLSFFLLGVVIAPLIEEVVFRGSLVFHGVFYYFIFAAFITNSFVNFNYLIELFFGKQIIKIIAENPFFDFTYAFLKIVIIYGLFFAFGNFLTKKLTNFNKNLILFWKKNIKFYIITTTFIFALAHINNFGLLREELFSKYIFLFPFVVLPQFLSGFILAYTALKFGLQYSILLHGLNNLLLVFIPGIINNLIIIFSSFDNFNLINSINIKSNQITSFLSTFISFYFIFIVFSSLFSYFKLIRGYGKDLT